MAKDRPETGEFDRARRKRRLKKQARRLLALLAALVLLCAVFAGLAVYFKMDLRSSAENILAGLRSGGGFPVSTAHVDVTELLSLDSGVAVCSLSGVDIYNANGALLGSFRGRYIRPVACAGGGKAMIYDLGGRSVLVTNKVSEQFGYTSEGDIQAGDICSTGAYAFAESSADYLSRVRAYNPVCEEMYVWSTNECYVTSIALTSGGKSMAVAGVGASGGRIKSWVRFHDFHSTEEVAAVALADQLVVSMEWNRAGELQVVTDSGIYVFDSSGRELHRLGFSGKIAGIANSEEGYIYLALGDYRAQGGTVITAYDADLTELGSAAVQRELLSMELSQGRLFILAQGQFLLGDKTLSEVSDRGVGDLFMLCPSGTYYYAVSPQGLTRSKL